MVAFRAILLVLLASFALTRNVLTQENNVLDLKRAGFSAAELKGEGFTVDHMRHAYTVGELFYTFSATDDFKQGDNVFVVGERRVGTITAAYKNEFKVRFSDGTSRRGYLKAYELLKVHRDSDLFSLTELIEGGVTFEELMRLGISASELQAELTLAELAQMGMSISQLKDSGFSVVQCKNEGFTAAQLKEAYTIAEMRDGGYSVSELAAVATIPELKLIGCTAAHLKAEGFTVEQVKDYFNLSDMLFVFSVQSRFSQDDSVWHVGEGRVGTVSAAYKNEYKVRFADGSTHSGNVWASGLLKAEKIVDGFTLSELLKGGITFSELTRIGVLASEFQAELSLSELMQRGLSMAEIKGLGVTAEQFKQEGFTAAQVKEAFTLAEMRECGFSLKDLMNRNKHAPSVKGMTPSRLLSPKRSDEASEEIVKVDSHLLQRVRFITGALKLHTTKRLIKRR